MSNKITSCLYKPGTRIVVTPKSKNGSFPPGTTGFMSRIKTMANNPSVVASFAIIRKGKTGKDRLDINDMTFPLTEVEEPFFLNTVFGENRKGGPVSIKSSNSKNVDSNKLSTLEFLAWSISCVTYLKHISKSAKYTFWPEANDHPLSQIMRAKNKYYDEPDFYLEKVESAKYRSTIVNAIREMESQLVQAGKMYMATVSTLKQQSIQFVKQMAENEEAKFSNETKTQINELFGG